LTCVLILYINIPNLNWIDAVFQKLLCRHQISDGRTDARTGVTLNAPPPFFEWRGHNYKYNTCSVYMWELYLIIYLAFRFSPTFAITWKKPFWFKFHFLCCNWQIQVIVQINKNWNRLEEKKNFLLNWKMYVDVNSFLFLPWWKQCFEVCDCQKQYRMNTL